MHQESGREQARRDLGHAPVHRRHERDPDAAPETVVPRDRAGDRDRKLEEEAGFQMHVDVHDRQERPDRPRLGLGDEHAEARITDDAEA